MEKIWLKSYPPGVPEFVPEPGFRSIRDMMEHSFEEYPDHDSYYCMGTTMSFRELDEQSNKFAGYLQGELGLTRGERVALMMPNILQYPVALCGIFRAGLVAVNVNPLYTARELEHQLKDSGAKAIVILENFAHILEEVVAGTGVKHIVTTGVGDLLSKPKGWIVNFVLRSVRKQVPAYRLPGSRKFSSALNAGAKHEVKPVELGYADIAFLQYTGGTTGVSKGAMLSHRNMVYNVMQTVIWQGNAYIGVEPVTAITALPLYHIFSLQGNCLTVMAQGGLKRAHPEPSRLRRLRERTQAIQVQLLHGRQHVVCIIAQHARF